MNPVLSLGEIWAFYSVTWRELRSGAKLDARAISKTPTVNCWGGFVLMSILTISRSQSRATQVRHPRSLSSFGRLAPQRLAPVAKCLCACLLLVATAAPLSASTIELPLAQEYSGASPPAGSSPWLTVKFDDQNTPGSVVFTVEATNLTGTEFISGLYLNIDSSIDPADLSFGVPTKTGSFADPTISLATDSFNAAGGSKYDILLGFSKKSSDRFGVGEEVKYTLTGTGSASGARCSRLCGAGYS